MAISAAALTAEFTNMNFGFGPNALEQALINSYASQTTIAGGLTDEQARLATAQLVGDTTAVAGLTYQFFTGGIPSEAGFYFLVNSEGNGDLNPNPNDLNDPYYSTFNQENRYYNFALNLARPGGEGAADFAATYGALSNADAVFVAYENIVGTAAAIDAGINPTAARADILGRFAFFRQVAIERGGIADTAANAAAIDIATKAVMVAYLLNEAFKASVGNLVDSFERFLIDLGVDGDATFGADVIAAYPGADDAMEFTLTSGADAGAAFTGGSGDDTFFATEDTLTSTDILKGGAGDDTLIIATSGSSDVVLAGFDTESIEEFQLTSDADSTRLDVSGAEDLQRIINTNSSSDVTLTGMVPTIDVTIENTTQENGGGTVNTTIQYVASATAGDNTRQQITLTNVIDPVDEDGQTRIDLIGNADNVEIVDLIVGGENILTYLDSLSLDEVNVTGTGDLTLEGVGFDAATNVFNAANLQGDLDVTFDTSGVNDVVATGGEGDDRFDYQAGFDVGDSVTGGAGSDLLVLNVDTGIEQSYTDNGDVANAARGTASGVEVVTLASGVFDDTINMANLGAAVTTLNVNTEVDGTVTLANLLSTTTVVINHNLADLDGDELIVDFVGDGSSDELNLTINNLGGASGDGFLTLSDDTGAFGTGDNDSINTLDLVINDDAAGGELVLSLNDLDDMTTWNIAGNADLDADSGVGDTGALVTVNGGTSTGDINLTDVTFGASVLNGAGISITTGSGNDEIGNAPGSTAAASLIGNDTINTGAGNDLVYSGLGNDTINLGSGADEAHGQQGNDVINGGDGNDDIWGNFGLDTLTGGTGADTFHYTNILDSQGVTVDVITDFQSDLVVGAGNGDRIDLVDALIAAGAPIVFSEDVIFVGNATTFGNAVTALSASNTVEAVFVQDTQILYVDVNGDGNIDTNLDMAIQLTGVAALTADDIQATFRPITFTAFAPGFDTSVPATSVEGQITEGGRADVINTTIANLSGSIVDGAGDGATDTEVDILNITDQVMAPVTLGDGAAGGTIDGSIDRINLRQGSTAVVTGPSNADMIIAFGAATLFETADGANGQTINGSGQADQITVEAENGVINARGGNDLVILNGGGDFGTVGGVASLDGGAGTDTLELNGGAEIVGAATVTGFEVTDIANNSTSIRLSASVHQAIEGTTIVGAAGGAGEALTIVGGGTLTGLVEIETYVLADDPLTVGTDSVDFTIGFADQDVTESGVNATVRIGGASITGTYSGFDGGDTLVATSGADLTGANGGGSLGFGTLNLTGSVSMFDDQHAFAIVATGGADSVNILDDGNMSGISTDADVETYNISAGNSVGDTAFFVTINGATQIVNRTADAVGDDDTDFTLGIAAFSGQINGNGTTNDSLTLTTGQSIVGATITGVEDLTIASGASVSMDEDDYDAFTTGGGVLTFTGTQTVTIGDAGTITAYTAVGNEIENYVLSSGPDTFTIDLAALDANGGAGQLGYTVALGTGGSDTVVLNNSTYNAAGQTDYLVINGFELANDVLDIRQGAIEFDAAFASIAANANTALLVGDESVVEVQTASILTSSFADVSDAGAVEGVIAAAIGDVTAGGIVAGDNVAVILYDAAGTAYLYQVDVVTADTDLQVGDFTVEMVGAVTGVGVNNLDGSDFI